MTTSLSPKVKNAIIDLRISGRSFLDICAELKVPFQDLEKTVREEVISRLISGYKCIDIAFDMHLKPSYVIAMKKLMNSQGDGSKIEFPPLDAKHNGVKMFSVLASLVVASLVVLCPTKQASALEAYLTMENDTLAAKRDSQYTHGTEGELVTDDGYHFIVSQTMYAPHDLRRKDHIKGDRPYCGMLIGGIGYEFFKDEKSPWTNYGELDFGVIGPAAGCKQTQKFVHKLLNCKDPQGWDNQLHNEIVVNGQWWTKYNWHLCDWLAIVPRVGAAAGNIQDMVEIGCDVKIGWNMRPTVNNEIIFSATRDESWMKKLTAYVFAGVGERYYLYNHILEGSMFNNKDDGLDVDIKPLVTEFRYGVIVKYDRFFVTYYNIHRTDEYKHQPDPPVYGGIGFGWVF